MNFILVLLSIHSLISIAYDDKDGTLPVELYYFKAEIISDYVLVTWGTATEVDNYGFNLERSSNLNEWTTLEFLPGYGTSNIPRDYSFEDTTVISDSIYYYRLKQIDIVGSFAYSDTISIHFITELNEYSEIRPAGFYLYQNYPNPFNAISKIKFELAKQSKIRLAVFDQLGVEVAELFNEELQPGIYESEFNSSLFSQLSTGIYLYRLSSGSNSLTKKLLLLK